MKKTLILLFVAALGAGTMSSCKKTNKGKMTGEWTVSSYTFTNTRTEAGLTETWVSTSDGTNMTSSYTDANGTTTTDAPVQETMTYSILKDGTYSTTTTTVTTSTVDNFITGTVLQNVTTTDVTNTSGTWSFVKKNKTADFKTNERIVFNETASDWTSTVVSKNTTEGANAGLTEGTSSDDSSSADDPSYSGNSMMFVVTSSKKKELVLSLVNSSTSNSSSTDISGTNVKTPEVKTTSDRTMTLTQ